MLFKAVGVVNRWRFMSSRERCKTNRDCGDAELKRVLEMPSRPGSICGENKDELMPQVGDHRAEVASKGW